MKFLLLLLILQGTCAIGQVGRGQLISGVAPSEIEAFISIDKIALVELRKLTDFLTNADVTQYDDFFLSKRKKAFVRHVKHLSEALELTYFKGSEIDQSDKELLYELLLFRQAIIRKAALSVSRSPKLKEKISMLYATKRSKSFFKYPVVTTYKLEDLQDPKNSPYWHNNTNNTPLHKRFSELAKLKKIKARKNMVVLFDELSYSGSAPKIRTMDLDLDNEWSLKWGDEVHTDVLGSRIFAALGYDVDHPYYYGKDELTLVFDGTKAVKNASQLCDSINLIYNLDLRPFITVEGVVSAEIILENDKLTPFLGKRFVRFKKCGLEARPDRVKRIGPFIANELQNENRRALKGAVLAHAFIDNWDTREGNTLLTTVHNGNYSYRMSAVFSDLGTSFGVRLHSIPVDFKVGLVNDFDWEVAELKRSKVFLNYRMDAFLAPYKNADYLDLKWMAQKIADLNENNLRKMVAKAGWPKPVAELYFHKLAARRASIIQAFELIDPHPITFNKALCISIDGVAIVEDGELMVDYKWDENPESFLGKKGRFRNYGN